MASEAGDRTLGIILGVPSHAGDLDHECWTRREDLPGWVTWGTMWTSSAPGCVGPAHPGLCMSMGEREQERQCVEKSCVQKAVVRMFVHLRQDGMPKLGLAHLSVH